MANWQLVEALHWAFRDAEAVIRTDMPHYMRTGRRLLEAMDGCGDPSCVITAFRMWKAILAVDARLAVRLVGYVRDLAHRYYGDADLGTNEPFLTEFALEPSVIVYKPNAGQRAAGVPV